MGAIGNIYSKTSFLDLADFETNGGFTVAAGKISSPADATKYIKLPQVTMLDTFNLQMRFKWLSDSSSDTGLQVGIYSINTVVATWDLYINAVLKTSDANRGKLHIQSGDGGVDYYSPSALPAVSVNDIFLLTLDYNQGIILATLANETTGTNVTYSFTNTFVVGAATNVCNSGKVGIKASATAYEIQFLQYSSAMAQNVPLAVGDSITQGYFGGSPAGRWAQICGLQISAGGGDRMEEILQRTDEIINFIKPSIIYLMIGTNDVGHGDSVSQLLAHIDTFVQLMELNGINVIKLATTPPNPSSIKDGLLVKYPGTTITGTYDGMRTGSVLNAAYDSGDGVHPNAAGHAHLASIVQAFIPQYTVGANQPNVVVSRADNDFASLGISNKNTDIIYLVGSALISYVPGRPINGITGFESGKGYYFVSKINRDYGVVLSPPAS